MPAYVEIMHDQASGQLPTGAIERGLQILEPLVGELAVVRDNRQIKIADPTADIVRADRIKWPQLPANITVVMTDRQLFSTEERLNNPVSNANNSIIRRVAGIAFIGSDVAIVSLQNSTGQTGVSTTAAHEVAHLYEVLKTPNDSSGHCRDDHCIMFPDTGVLLQEQRTDETTRLKRFKARLGKADVESYERPAQIKFCAHCEVDLLKRSPAMSQRFAMKTMRTFSK